MFKLKVRDKFLVMIEGMREKEHVELAGGLDLTLLYTCSRIPRFGRDVLQCVGCLTLYILYVATNSRHAFAYARRFASEPSNSMGMPVARWFPRQNPVFMGKMAADVVMLPIDPRDFERANVE